MYLRGAGYCGGRVLIMQSTGLSPLVCKICVCVPLWPAVYMKQCVPSWPAAELGAACVPSGHGLLRETSLKDAKHSTIAFCL